MMETHTNQEPRKRTRAEVIRESVHIRLATDECGPLIAEVLKENGIELPGVTWEKVFPHWLVAMVGEQAIGCLQVMPAKPVAWCEFLLVRKSAPFKLRAIAIRKLIDQGMATARLGGATYVSGMVNVQNEKFVAVLERYGFQALAPHLMMAKKV